MRSGISYPSPTKLGLFPDPQAERLTDIPHSGAIKDLVDLLSWLRYLSKDP
jgi:hypothetical protein